MKTPRKAFYVLLGSLGLAVAGGIGVYSLFDGQLASLNQDLSQLLAEQEAAKSQIQKLEATDQQLRELEDVSSLADDVLPTQKEQGNIVAELKSFILDAGLGFDSVTFSGSDGASGNLNISQTQARPGLVGVRVLPVTAIISAGANYSEVIDLLETIENNQRKMQVTQLALTPEAGGSVFASITMQIDVYVRVEAPPAATTPESPTGEAES